MVRQPRSRGCRICVQRRVRCDLARPICLRCQKGNRPCPGYPPDLKIQDETTKLLERFGQNRQKEDGDKSYNGSAVSTEIISTLPSEPSFQPNEEPAPLPDTTLSYSQLECTSITTTDQSKDCHLQWNLAWSEETAIPENRDFPRLTRLFLGGLSSPNVQQSQLVSLFRSSMAPKKRDALRVFRQHSDWLDQLSSIQGSNLLLDTTFRAVSLAHLSLLHHDPNLMHESRKLYGRSLGLLNKAISDQHQGRSSETLCATVLLSFYEMFTSNHETSVGYDSWVKHAGGAGALMRLRGPNAHRHGLDRSTFLAYRNALVIEAFESGKACFLDEPEWQKLAADIHKEVQATMSRVEGRYVFDISEDFFKELVRLPSAFSDAQNVAALARATSGNRKSVLTDIVSRTKKHRANLKALSLRFDLALQHMEQGITEGPSVPHDPVFPVRYEYPNIFMASHYVGYWNVLMVMNTILVSLDDDKSARDVYMLENIEAARNVCRSAEYMSTSSLLVLFFLTFALRASVHALDADEEKQWVVKKLLELGEKLGMAKAIAGPEGGVPGALQRSIEELDKIE